MRSCLSAIGCGTLLLAGLAAGWLFHEEIGDVVAALRGKDEAATEVTAPDGAALAREVEERIVALGQGRVDEVVLSVQELDSWIRYGLQGFFPSYISDVTAGIEDEALVLAGRVAMRELPGASRLGAAVALLGDTAMVTARGRLDGLAPGRGVMFVDNVQVGPMPLPDAWRDQLLAQLRAGAADLPANAVPFDLPRFVTDVGVRGDHVVLRGTR
ncbi:MAG: hypothetical protein JSU87_04055 [Gemmatimonadota bacterium]|nr:MAG: hypothetical protein JSU87_04055 [Gemmatimonadota bacterium]